MSSCVQRFPRILQVHSRLHSGSLLTAFAGLTELAGEPSMMISGLGFTLPRAKDIQTSMFNDNVTTGCADLYGQDMLSSRFRQLRSQSTSVRPAF